MSPIRILNISAGLFILSVVALLQGCGDTTSSASYDSVSRKHDSGWLPAGHKGDAQAHMDACAECHGTDYSGGISKVSCTGCHLGGPGNVHPVEWGDFAYSRHAEYVSQNGTSACANVYCHGAGLNGVTGSGPSCTSCHLGGVYSYHPLEWGGSTSNHDSYVATYGTASCANAACHGAQGQSGSGTACATCHNVQMIP